MSKPVVFLTSTIPEKGIQLLSDHYTVRLDRGKKWLTKAEIMDSIHDAAALVCLLTDTIDREIIDAARNVKIIANYAVGFNNIDVPYATEKGVLVTNTPGVLTETTAELAWALIFAVSRHIVVADRFVRNGLFQGWDPMLMLGYDISHKTLGLIGMGRIGQAVARMAAGFDMKILYYDLAEISLDPSIKAVSVSLDELCTCADIISVHTPLSKQTYHLCDDSFFRKCHRDTVFINTSRGPVVDEHALADALERGDLAGAGLDVYEQEPVIYHKLLHCDNVVLLPHLGSATHETRENMAIVAATNVIEALNGRKPPHLVNPEAYA